MDWGTPGTWGQVLRDAALLVALYKKIKASLPKRLKPKPKSKRDIKQVNEDLDQLENVLLLVAKASGRSVETMSKGFESLGCLVKSIEKLVTLMDERRVFQCAKYIADLSRIVKSQDARLKVLESSMAGHGKGGRKKIKASKSKGPLQLGFDIPENNSGKP
jgi:hypothetical protein